MADTTFESVTRVAIEEMIRTHARPSKFGFVLTEEGFIDLSSDLFDLLVTSRNLKAAGDRFIQNKANATAPTGRPGASPGRRPGTR